MNYFIIMENGHKNEFIKRAHSRHNHSLRAAFNFYEIFQIVQCAKAAKIKHKKKLNERNVQRRHCLKNFQEMDADSKRENAYDLLNAAEELHLLWLNLLFLSFCVHVALYFNLHTDTHTHILMYNKHTYVHICEWKRKSWVAV